MTFSGDWKADERNENRDGQPDDGAEIGDDIAEPRENPDDQGKGYVQNHQAGRIEDDQD